MSRCAAAVALVSAVVLVPASSAAPGAPSFHGRVVFSRGGPHGGLYVLRAGDTRPAPLTARPGDAGPAWSPDGSRVAFVRYRKGSSDVYVVRSDGSRVRRLTSDGASSSPAWSPRGTIALARAVAGNADVYVMDAEGGATRRLTHDRGREYAPSDWSPDGSKLTLVGYRKTAPASPVRLYVMDADGSGLRKVGPPNATSPSWSPDGKHVAFVDAIDGSIRVLRVGGGGGVRTLLDVRDLPDGTAFAPNFTSRPAWSSDGEQLVFAAGSAGTSHLYLLDLRTSAVRQLTHGRVQDESPAWFRA